MKLLIATLTLLALLPSVSQAAEKDRGYCGRIIKVADLPSAKSAYSYGDEAVNSDLVLAIACSSEPIDTKISNEELASKIENNELDQEIAFAEIHDSSARLDQLAKSKQNVCVRARWASPGPCGGYSTIDSIHTTTDSIHSIIPLERETFKKRYYPEGKDIQ